MKIMKSQRVFKLILIIIVLSCCNSNNKETNKEFQTPEISSDNDLKKPVMDTIDIVRNYKITGIAKNEKPGAIIDNDNGTYIIKGLRQWDSCFLDKTVCVWGDLEFCDNTIVTNNNEPTLARQEYPKYYVVSNAKWDLCE